jgi:hypothetical protein
VACGISKLIACTTGVAIWLQCAIQMPVYCPAMLLFIGIQWLPTKPLPKILGLWPDQPQIRNVPDKDLPSGTQNPQYPDKDGAILRPRNPLFSGQTYGGASGGLTVHASDYITYHNGSATEVFRFEQSLNSVL